MASKPQGVEPKRLIVGISGASGVIYGVRMLEILRDKGIESHLVMSKSAEMTLAYETDLKPKDIKALASVVHPAADIGASISSGSFKTMGMVIAPCSIRTMSEIATGVTSSLVSRAADVVLKEKKKLILVPRETPLSLIHVKNMELLLLAGATLIPANPSFYSGAKTVVELVDTVVARVLDHIGLPNQLAPRWAEEKE